MARGDRFCRDQYLSRFIPSVDAAIREGLICGPSTGMCLKGLFTWLDRAKKSGDLDKYREPGTSDVNCIFVCCDLPQQYMQGYHARLSPEDFRPILNEVCESVLKSTFSQLIFNPGTPFLRHGQV